MPDRDIILSKANAIKRSLKRIKDVTGLVPDSLDDLNTQDIFVLNLQRAIQSAIDLAAHVVAAEGLGLPDAVKGNFQLLDSAGVINQSLSKRMQSMAGFRNIAIHDYQSLNVNILKSILEKHLPDLEEFYSTVLQHFKLA